MAKRKKNEEVILPVSEDTPIVQEIVVEKVEGEALPEITEENINEVKEAPAVEEAPVEEKAEKPKRTRKATAKKPTEKKSAEKKPATKEIKKPINKEIKLDNLVWLYSNSAIQTTYKTITGTIYLWDNNKVTGRYPITTVADGAGKLEALSGWVDAEDLGME